MPQVYTIVYTPAGISAVTLCDLSAGWWPEFVSWPQDGVEQVDRLAFGAALFRQMRGNVGGDAVFKIGHSHASADAAAAWFQAQTRLQAAAAVAGSGILAVTINATVWSYTGATFRKVEATKMNGSEWWLRYTFGTAGMDAAPTDAA